MSGTKPKIRLGEIIEYHGADYPVIGYKVVRKDRKSLTASVVGVYIKTSKGRTLVDLPTSMHWESY